jgi:hypothetical protein
MTMNVQVAQNLNPNAQAQLADPPAIKHPNLFELAGDGISVSYASTSFGGKPLLSYHDQFQSKSFIGDQIRTVETEIGTLVTVTVFITVDAGSTSFSILIPNVNLRSSDSAQISTYGITTLHRFSIFGPPQGQSEFYTAHQLSGTASFVVS